MRRRGCGPAKMAARWPTSSRTCACTRAQVGTRARSRRTATLRCAMRWTTVAVRPPYGGHPRVAIYGLLESRMSARRPGDLRRACNEGTWPASAGRRSAARPRGAARARRARGGLPHRPFRARSCRGARRARSRAQPRAARRERAGDRLALPAAGAGAARASLPMRHRESEAPRLAAALDKAAPAPPYPRPEPMPSAEQRKVAVSVTGLDRLRADPYQFYASSDPAADATLDALDAEPSAAWQGTVGARDPRDAGTRPVGRSPQIAERRTARDERAPADPRAVAAAAAEGARMGRGARSPPAAERTPRGVREGRRDRLCAGSTLHGRADRIDRLPDGTLAVIDYKTGKPPSGAQVEEGFALQLGTLGLMVERGAFEGVAGTPDAVRILVAGASDKDERVRLCRRRRCSKAASRSGIAARGFPARGRALPRRSARPVDPGQRAVHRAAQSRLRRATRLRPADAARRVACGSEEPGE